MVTATIVVPTFDHGPTLRFSVASALAQTIEDVEVLLVGDGMPDEAREVAAELCRADERVRLFDNAKGERHGELHRHRALADARGRVVCYLSDDDLYLPNHVETVVAALEEADFVHAQPLRVERDGTLGAWAADLSLPFYRQLLLGGENRIPLSCGAHTLALYRRLPHGWRTTPPPTPTDLYMWQQLLEAPGVRARSTYAATTIHFPSPDRREWTREQRLEELELWARRASEPGLRDELVGSIERALAAAAAAAEVDAHVRATLDASEAVAAAYEATLTFRLRRRAAGLPLAAKAVRALRRG